MTAEKKLGQRRLTLLQLDENSETCQRSVDVRLYPGANSTSISDLSRNWALKD